MRAFKSRSPHFVVVILASTLLSVACGVDEPLPTPEPGSGALLELDLSSPDFGDMENIPTRFTCDGVNESPRLEWGPVPEGTQALAIIVDDPGAPDGIFNHWVVYDLPVELRGLSANQPSDETLPGGGTQGQNDAGGLGWTGPCPPPGPAHQYDFFLYALSARLAIEAGAGREEVVRTMREAGVIGVGTFAGLYARP